MVCSAVHGNVMGDLFPGYFRKTLALVERSAAIIETVQFSGDDRLQQLDLPYQSAFHNL
jgi:hypothetical protein